MQTFNAIITYTISDDDLREEFMELIEEIGFLPQEDQSTYALPTRRPYDDNIAEELKEFCNEKLKKDDHVDYYWLAYQFGECIGMVLNKYRYKPRR